MEQQHQAFEVLKARIETSLQQNNPKKYQTLRASGKLAAWIESQAQQAAEAMNSTTSKANEGQRTELAHQFLNPQTEDQEATPADEETPEDHWLANREQPIILDAPPTVQ